MPLKLWRRSSAFRLCWRPAPTICERYSFKKRGKAIKEFQASKTKLRDGYLLVAIVSHVSLITDTMAVRLPSPCGGVVIADSMANLGKVKLREVAEGTVKAQQWVDIALPLVLVLALR